MLTLPFPVATEAEPSPTPAETPEPTLSPTPRSDDLATTGEAAPLWLAGAGALLLLGGGLALAVRRRRVS